MNENTNENIENQDRNNPEKAVHIRLDIDDTVAQGLYSNLAISNFTKEEFIIDFVFLQPQMKKGKIRSRVILSPRNAKRLAQMLNANIRDYENKIGPITEDSQSPGIKFSFN